MNKRIIFKVIGLILMIEGALMLLPMIVALIYKENDWRYFLITGGASAFVGFFLYIIKQKKNEIHAREGYLIVALSWIVLSAVGAVPFVISGSIPNYLDALFETVSGFTTTGSTILDDIEALSKSMIFWRSFTHWIGGMGILVFMLAISPVAGGGTAMHMMRAESPGPTTEKISPRISTTAKYLYIIYFAMTIIEIVCLMIAKLSLYQSAVISFGTMATGGFSYLNSSMAAFTIAQQNIVTVFMVLAGVNFSLYFLLLVRKPRGFFENEELIEYIAIYVIVVIAVTLSVFCNGNFESFGEALQKSAFTVASVITTTGFSVCDMEAWPWFTKHLLMLIMFIGACAGSTAGGIKVSRCSITFKEIINKLRQAIHPRSVYTVVYNKKEMPQSVIGGALFYVCIFVLLFAGSMIIVSFDPRCDFTTAFSAVDTTINNNGIAFAGATGSFYSFAWYSKVVFIIDMLIGRLEIFPIVILIGTLFSPVTHGMRSFRRKTEHKINHAR